MSDTPQFPNSLAYVRSQRKLSLEAVAKAVGTTAQRLGRYELGELVPTPRQYTLLEAIYGVADYVLAGAEKPELDPLLVDFRKEAGSPAELSPSGLRAYFRARDFVDAVAGLAELSGRKPTKQRPERVSPNQLPELLERLRRDMEFDPTNREEIDDPDTTFRRLRYKIEQYGVLCLVTQAKQSDFRGLYSESLYPFILINKKTFKTKARLFTLIHEFAHFLLDQKGVSDPFITNNDLERSCNYFASEFLSPHTYFDMLYRAAQERSNDIATVVSEVSSNCLLSKGAVAWRLKLEGRISGSRYREWRAAMGLPEAYGEHDGEEDAPDELEARGGGNYALNVIADLGYEPILTTKAALDAGAIDEVDAGRLLNARGRTLEAVFRLVDGRVEGFAR
jgi:Zn-dependent peptidase ImmA (M78 family)